MRYQNGCRVFNITIKEYLKMQGKDFIEVTKPQPTVLGADVYAWFPDGTVKQITGGDGIYVHPCVHPDGGDVIFYGGVSGPSRIYKADLASGQITALTAPETTADNAGYSWGGEKIVFCSDRASGRGPAQVKDIVRFPPPVEGSISVFVMDSDGGNVQQVTWGTDQDQRPCFSPDGETIAFVSNRDGTPGQFRLWTVPADAGEQPHLLNPDVLAYRPWYSKDGEFIYFFTFISNRQQVCKISAEGGDFTVLKNDDKGDSRGPFVDPDGQVLLVHSNRAGIWQIWEIPLDEVTPPRLVQPPGFPKATHPTRARNGVITFDVWRVQE